MSHSVRKWAGCRAWAGVLAVANALFGCGGAAKPPAGLPPPEYEAPDTLSWQEQTPSGEGREPWDSDTDPEDGAGPEGAPDGAGVGANDGL